MKCPYCGYQNSNKAKFCKNCGKNIEEAAQDASYESYDDLHQTRQPRKIDGMKIALLGVCAVLVVAVGLLAFAIIRRHNDNLRADESGETFTTTAEESETKKIPDTEKATEASTEADTQAQQKTAAASTASVTVPGETVQSTTEAADQTTQKEASYFAPAGEEELPSTEEEVKAVSGTKEGDYVYEAASLYPGDFYFANSDSTYLDEDDLQGFTEYECDIARNEIYARHGYTFQTEKFENYFKQFAWYEEDPNYSDARLNTYEKKNASMILSYEKDKGWK